MEQGNPVKKPLFGVPKPLWIGMGLWAAFFLALCAWKYWTFRYRDLDLAYFTQVFWNTVHGRFFGLSLHPHLSLGDHAEWLILPLSSAFFVLRSPLTLLGLQAVALAAGAIPLWRIASRRLPAAWAYGVAFGYLALAFPQNAALFEFHLLPFALPLLLAAADAYDRRNFRLFVLWLCLALAVREDVALAVVGFAAVAALERRGKNWIVIPLGLSAMIAALDLVVISRFAVNHAYKFSVYYDWLGGPAGVLASPAALLGHLVSLPVLEFLLGLLMPFLILPLVRPRWLLLSVLPILAVVLERSGGGALALEMHYASLALPGVLLASVAGLEALLSRKIRSLPSTPIAGGDRRVFALVLGLALLASQLTVGPLPGIVRAAFRPADADARAAARLAARVPPFFSVAAADSLLPAFAKRDRLYAVKYLMLGTTQYGAAPYAAPELPEFIALDADDALVGAVQFPALGWTAERWQGAAARLRKLLADGRYGAVFREGRFSLWQAGFGNGATAPAGTVADQPTQVGRAKVHALTREPDCADSDLCLALTLSLDTDPGEDLAVSLVPRDKDGKPLGAVVRLLGDQLFPTHEWRAGEVHAVRIRLPLARSADAASASLLFFRPRGALVMGPLRSSQLLLAKPEGEGTQVTIR